MSVVDIPMMSESANPTVVLDSVIAADSMVRHRFGTGAYARK